MQMPFGKHRFCWLDEIPADYLYWVIRNVDLDRWWGLSDAIRKELNRRAKPRQQADPPPPTIDIDRWFRKLSIEFHPDRGGTKEAQQAIERGRQLLLEMTKR